MSFKTPVDPPTTEQLLTDVAKLFREKFQVNPTIAAFAPGRVNLIGEHTDYNDGFVLPFALPYKTIIAAAPHNNSSTSTIISAAKPEEPVRFDINNLHKGGPPSWSNYVTGTIYQYREELPKNAAFNAIIISNVPIGSGLSSSAALEVATGTLLEKLYNLQVDKVTKALRAQKAEHDFVGTPCGIMDQFISAMGQTSNLLLIDCRSREFKLVPFGIGDATSPVVLVCNSNVKHELSGSEYPDRVRQCKAAVAVIQKQYPQVKALRDATLEMLQQVKDQLSEVEYKRARHVITEGDRTLTAVESLKNADYETVGRLMTESHFSLKDDYEVSCEELDFLVTNALKVKGVFGSRITGGGFGGCSVTLVAQESVGKLKAFLEETYWKQYHLKCECYVTAPAEGCGYLDLVPTLDALDRERTPPSSSRHNLRPAKESSWVDYVVPGAVIALSVAVGAAYIFRRKF